ncbi:PREDICTED: hypoxia up-regulated protein 1 [Nicrophorus vespilloides]|uniref:Hypoxia up-regulated protein 1 n=1 Tax=Nicrophorus vespilloides TaxID=110193 RepID=A0ABM1MC69_NICVS|nr:PREDICTED: hypoxia up-regulated protein 1 [Nicrophorus vespilloides]
MKLHLALAIPFLLLALNKYASGLAVMSIDFGSEWMKIGIVSPGVPMEIALNKESKRKSPAVLSLRDDVRNIGEDAQTVGIRFPKSAYFYLLELLGKNINHPIVELYKSRFPYYEIVADEERGTILLKHDDDVFYSPEELIAQLLHKAKEIAEQNARQPIKECVITVPAYFNQVERKALLQAAQLADIKVLQLMNDHMAVALNYGIFHTKDFNETAQYVMFFDMGASSTTVSIVSMQNVKVKERGYTETHPQISVVGLGYDRTLGGLELQIRLRDYLAKKFNAVKKTKNDVFDNHRSMAKLFKEAGRVKNILSANPDHYAQIEGLLDDEDFRVQVTREDFEDLAGDFFDRVAKPVEQALASSGIALEFINQVVLVGAGTRVPKVQEKLQEVVKMDLAKNLNTDEAATMGAVYKAADLSTGFQVKKFITKDAVIFPLQVFFERGENNGLGKRTLFGLMNFYPQKKTVTFSKHSEDFSITLNYAQLEHLSSVEIGNLGSLNLTEFDLKGVQEAMSKNVGDNIQNKGVKVQFGMDESGILSLTNVEASFEKSVTDEDDEGTLSKLGSTISKLFSRDEEEKPVQEDPEVEQKVENKTQEANKTAEAQPKEVKPKVINVKEPLQAIEKILTIKRLNKQQIEDATNKLEKLNKIDQQLYRRASALNSLESFVIDVQNKLYEDEYSDCVLPEDKEKIITACSETSDWLYEDGADADALTYETKLAGLKTLTSDLFKRVFEHSERPQAVLALREMLNASTHFMVASRNLTKEKNPEKDVYTETEIETLAKLIKNTEEWLVKQIAEQDKLKKHDNVVLSVKILADKMQELDREVKYLVNKLKMWRPKKVEKPVVEENNETKEEPSTTSTKGEEKEEEAAESTNKGEETEEKVTPTASSDEEKHSEL